MATEQEIDGRILAWLDQLSESEGFAIAAAATMRIKESQVTTLRTALTAIDSQIAFVQGIAVTGDVLRTYSETCRALYEMRRLVSTALKGDGE